jgi:hypothetical protein
MADTPVGTSNLNLERQARANLGAPLWLAEWWAALSPQTLSETLGKC